MPAHGRDPDDILHILEEWSDVQLEGFFKCVRGEPGCRVAGRENSTSWV